MKENSFKPFIDEYAKSLKIRNLGKRTITDVCWKLDKFTCWLIKNEITHIDGINKERGRNNFPNYASQLQVTFARSQITKISK